MAQYLLNSIFLNTTHTDTNSHALMICIKCVTTLNSQFVNTFSKSNPLAETEEEDDEDGDDDEDEEKEEEKEEDDNDKEEKEEEED